MSDGIKVGARVEITGKGLQGVVSFIGATMFASGKWIGVALDEPLGKNDGSVQGKRYFTCGLNHGVFVRPPQVQVLASPPAVKKFGSELQPPSAIKRPSTGDHRSSSPSRLPSRLQTPSSLQKPKAGLNRPFAPKEMSSAPAVSEPEVPIVPEPVTVQAPVSPEPAPVQKFSYSAAPTLAPGISMVEIDSLKGQVKEWKEKYETIRIKRQEDRAKLKDFEKMRIHIQQLSDNKIRASEQIQELSKQLREAKKAAEEAVESKEHYVEEMADVHETIEMATLDKEMAEEKADILQKEVDNLTDKVEELQTDLEIMKAEIEESGTDGAVNNYQVKQLEDQNTKLKEALVRMRDLSTAEKAEYSKLEKQLEKKEKEWKEVTTKKDKIADQLTKAETTVDELKEQVDAAHAAEEMVETLTDKNLEQEEKIMDMEEQIHDLESMNEMNEELQESARENELELREELDLMRAKALEAQRQTEAANEVVADYQDTIQKFRKVVQDLQEANHELRTAQSEQEDKSDVESLVSQPPAFNYQIKMVESKAAARSIDHDLRKLEVSQANLRADLLSMFMPATFTRRGGDSDCVQVLLLVERLACKAKVIAKHVGEKFDTTANIVEGNELLGVRGEQLSFATSLICRLKGLEVLLEQYREALGKCSVERFQRIGTLFSEMLPHERVLEFLADLLRKDTLDETTNVSGLDKAIEFFQHLFNVHMSQEKFDCTKLMEQHLEQTQEVFSALSVNTYRLKSFLQVGQETSDVSILLKDIRTSCDDIRQFCKKVKRRMPQSSTNNSATRLEFAQEVKERLVQSFSSLASVNNIAYDWVMECSRRSGRAESSALPSRVMQEFFYKAASKVLEGKESSFSDAVRMSLGSVMATMNSLVTAMQEGEYDCNDPLPKIIAPIEKRAEAVKSEMTDSEGLTSKLEEKDETLNELRKVLKTKNDDISETKIRTGMLERKLEKANKEGSEKASVLQQRLDSMTEEVKKKEREYDETLDSLQNDIDTLEAEKFELKQRLAAQTKQRGALSDLAFKAPSLGATSGLASLLAGAAGATTTVSDSPLLTEQIKLLRTALRVKSIECSYLTGEKIMKELKELTPLNVPKLTPRSQDDVSKLKSDLGKLSETLTSLAIPKVIDISKRRAGSYPVGSSSPYEKLHDQQWKVRMAADRVQNLKLKVQQVLAKQGNKQVQSDFASFPTPQFVKSLSKSKPELIGNLRINDKSGKNNGHAIFLNLDQFKELHSIMYARSIR